MDSASPPRDPSAMHPMARVVALESELARVQQERDAEADDLAAMLVRIAETERAKGTAARAAQELGELVNALQVQLRDMQAREIAVASERATELATTRRRLEEAEQLLAESTALSEALRAGSGEAERKLQVARHQLGQAGEAVRVALGRAGLAERFAADGAEALQRANAQSETDRTRVVELETQIAQAQGDLAETLRARSNQHDLAVAALREEHGRTLATVRREHTVGIEEDRRRQAAEMAALGKVHEDAMASLMRKHDEAFTSLEQRQAHTLSAVREEHVAARRAAARAFEEERSAAARARQQIGTLEASLASMRGMAERSIQLLDELKRREELATALRIRTLQQAKQTLSGASCEPPAADALAPAALPVADSDSGTLDEIEMDLMD